MKNQQDKRFGQSFSFKKPRYRQQLKKRKEKALKKGDIVQNEIDELQRKIEAGIDVSQVNTFDDLPLSKNTLNGLKKAKYVTPTDIQKQAISLALQGRDVLGAAKTGSGKTLAFLIPILETLFKNKTSSAYGMEALIITPTRELAFQIYEVLNKIRTFHDFSANLVIGGKFMWRETHLMGKTNIVICTVGRLLHHLESTQAFDVSELKILVLDEADRIMDSKFAQDMDSIMSHLPPRQTLLFSATQTMSVKTLARLSLKDPSYVSVDRHAEYVTPTGLEQSYIVCELHEKLSLLYSFLKNHPNNKIMVFLQTCKQARYVHTVIKRERPGMSVLVLHGGIQQLRRLDIYREFCRKQHVILITTDLACRGLDFPAVNWVIQLDCPVDVNTYIHRAGRTARFECNGQALLVLLPSEEEHMVEALHRKKIPIKKISVNTKKLRDITGSISSACASCTDTKAMAERAFKTYVYSIHVMKNKRIFDVNKLDLAKFANSLGLLLTPRLRYLEKGKKKKKEESSDDSDDDADSSSNEDDDSSDDDDSDSSSDEQGDDKSSDDDDDDDDTEQLFKPKTPAMTKKVEKEESSDEDEALGEASGRTGKTKSKVAAAKKLLKRGITANTRVVFDEEGKPVRDSFKRQHSDSEEEDEGGINVQAAAKRLRVEDAMDKQIERERIKQKHREERIKKKEKKRAAQQQRRAEEGEEEEQEVVLSGADSDDDPFQYIPDPDKLATRNEDESDSDEDKSDEKDDDSNDDEGSSGNEEETDDDSESDDSEVSEENDDDQSRRRSLEDAAVKILQRSKLKK